MTTRLEKIEMELANLDFVHAGFREVGARKEMSRLTDRIWDLHNERVMRSEGYTANDLTGTWTDLRDEEEQNYWAEQDSDDDDAMREYNADIARQLMDVGYREAPDGSLYLPEVKPDYQPDLSGFGWVDDEVPF
jgi:hypothetical protein